MQAAISRFISLLFTFPLGFLAMLLVGVADLIWLHYAKLELPSPWLAFINIVVFAYAKIGFHGLLVGQIITSQKLIAFLKKIFLAAEYILLFIGAGLVLCFSSYLVCAWGYPLIDRELLILDRAIGFDWAAMFTWVGGEPIKMILHYAYISMSPQIAFLIVLFVFWNKTERIEELFWILFGSLSLTVILSGLFPVLGPGPELGMTEALIKLQPFVKDAYADVLAIRAADGTALTIKSLTGIVGFPSFHTCGAIGLIYAFRNCGWLTYIMVPLNLLMLLATPIYGNHYLMDMLAGTLIVTNIIIFTRIMERKARVNQSIIYA